MQKLSTLISLLVLAAVGLQAQNTVVVTDATLQGNQTYNWTNDNIYQLDGFVFLEEGGVLNIEAGTRIEGLPADQNATNDPGTLIITRGAQIFAEGTSSSPIVFSAEGDIDELLDPNILEDRGQWGGLIVLGRAEVGVGDGSGFANIEGIDPELRTRYGGEANPIDTDNSGVLRYVSIRFGGAELDPGDEINGLTLGGVGSGTTVEFVEVVANVDDGIEIFGGSVDVKHAVVAFCGDDMFDTDQNWSGRGQFWFAIQGDIDNGNSNANGGEHDGSEDDAGDVDGGAVQTVYNATFIGQGAANSFGGDNNALTVKDQAAIQYGNSIFTDYGDNAISLRNGSADRLVNNEFDLPNNIWFGFGAGATLNDVVDLDENMATLAQVVAAIAADGNELVSPALNGISRDNNGGLDPRPGPTSPARTGSAVVPTGDFFVQTNYRGAFGPTTNWAEGWSYLDEAGYFGDLAPAGQTIVIEDADLIGNTNYLWVKENIYQLDGFVYLEEGGCLTIEAGTRIEGLPADQNATNDPGTLIITRGAQIKAEGTREEPIIFSAEGDIDDLLDPNILEDRGQWGGLIILGRAEVGVGDGSGFANIEGIDPEVRTRYGGEDNPIDDDNSGLLTYVSIRFGGAELDPGDEINGLTLGGVGSGTIIENVEVMANVDDGIEFFGGSVDVKNAVVVFCGDDSFDTDQNWSGRGQFWLSIQGDVDNGNSNPNGGEHDGSEDDAGDVDGGAVQTVYNATYIGQGAANSFGGDNNALTVKDQAAIQYGNSIFTEFGDNALSLRNGSADRLVANEFDLPNNIWFGFGGGATLNDVVDLDENTATLAAVIAAIAADGNQLVDPEISQISWEASTNNGQDGNGTDPRPAAGSPARQGAANVPAGNFFTQTAFRGAFDPDGDYWADWTYAYERGFLVETLVSTTEFAQNKAGVVLTPSPNPTAGLVQLNVELPAASAASAMIFDQIGRQVARFELGQLQAGANRPTIDLSQLANGNYYVVMTTEFGPVSQRIVVNH